MLPLLLRRRFVAVRVGVASLPLPPPPPPPAALLPRAAPAAAQRALASSSAAAGGSGGSASLERRAYWRRLYEAGGDSFSLPEPNANLARFWSDLMPPEQPLP